MYSRFVTPIKRFVTDMGSAPEMTRTDLATGEKSQQHIPRYGIWEQGGHHHKAEVIATGDDLGALCNEHGVDPTTVAYVGPKPQPETETAR